MKKKKIREFKIKIPVYSTEIKQGNFTHSNVISRLRDELDNYNNNSTIARVAFNRTNKTQRKVIQRVDYFEHIIGEPPNETPSLLLKVTTFNTNILDGFTEDSDGIVRIFSNKTKLGSEHNYILFYPNFVGFAPNQKVNWLVFVYGDTNKNDTEITHTAKLIINGVLKLSFIHITPQEVLEKIRKKSVPVFKLRYTGIEKDLSNVEEKFNTYLAESKLKKDKTQTFNNIPFNLAEELLNQDFDEEEYQYKEAKFIYGKNEYTIKNKLAKKTEDEYDDFDVLIKEAQAQFDETVEHAFTDNFVLLETEMDKMYEQEYILEKISPIILNYVASYNI